MPLSPERFRIPMLGGEVMIVDKDNYQRWTDAKPFSIIEYEAIVLPDVPGGRCEDAEQWCGTGCNSARQSRTAAPRPDDLPAGLPPWAWQACARYVVDGWGVLGEDDPRTWTLDVEVCRAWGWDVQEEALAEINACLSVAIQTAAEVLEMHGVRWGMPKVVEP